MVNRDGSRGATTIGPYVVLAGPEALESHLGCLLFV